MQGSLDSDVLTILRETEFSMHETGGVRVFHNSADSEGDQKATLCFVKKYETAEEAQRAELLIDFYLRGLEKGTPKYATAAALYRAFTFAGIERPRIYTSRIQNQLVLAIDLSIPQGAFGITSLEQSSGILEELLTEPLIRTSGEVFAAAQQDEINRVKAKKEMHNERALSLFYHHFFPSVFPFGEEKEMRLISASAKHDLSAAIDAHISGSFPLLFFSGEFSVQEVAKYLLPFFEVYPCRGDRSALVVPPPLQLPRPESSVFVQGPSEEMQLLRAYPLARVPSEEERVALEVINYLLGVVWTSKFYKIIRDKHNLVYRIRSEVKSGSNQILITTGHKHTDYARIVKLTGEIFTDIARGNFTDDEIQQSLSESMVDLEGDIDASREFRGCNQPGFRVTREFQRRITGQVPDFSLE